MPAIARRSLGCWVGLGVLVFFLAACSDDAPARESEEGEGSVPAGAAERSVGAGVAPGGGGDALDAVLDSVCDLIEVEEASQPLSEPVTEVNPTRYADAAVCEYGTGYRNIFVELIVADVESVLAAEVDAPRESVSGLGDRAYRYRTYTHRRDPAVVVWFGDYYVRLSMRNVWEEDPDVELDHLEGFAALVLERLR